MASETGHAKNVANLETMISDIQSFGAAYNPPRANMKTPALTTMVGNARDAIQEVNNFQNPLSVATKQRETAFEDLDKLVTRVVNAVEISAVADDIGDRARTLARKLRGRRAGERIEDDPATPDVDESEQNVSVSQMSFDNQLANFEAFVLLLESQDTAYAPNETDLKADSLRTRADDMRAKNNAVTSAQSALDAARIQRNNVLYAEGTGLYDIAADIKTYVKSAFGATSPQYAQIKDLKFTKPR
jgi:hypothetical protein